MMKIRKMTLALLGALTTTVGAWGQGVPSLKKYNFPDNSFVSVMDRNGKWALTDGFEDYSATAKLVDLTKGTSTDISGGIEKLMTTALSDDGKTVAGTMEGTPVVWTKDRGTWQKLEMASSAEKAPEEDWNAGTVRGVTADGKYAAGYLDYNEWVITPALWDLTTHKIVPTPGLPVLDTNHEDHQQSRFSGISADGRYIVGCISPSYGRFNYIYDRETATYKVIGFDPSDTEAWTPRAKNMYAVFNAFPSNNFKYITGAASVLNPETDEFYYVPYRYEVATDQFELYDEDAVKGAGGYVVTDDGIVLASTPFEGSYRSWMVRNGKYWVSIESILKQKYGIDFQKTYGYENSGTVDNISNDGKRLLATVDFNSDGSSYILDFPQPIQKVLEGLRVLGTYTASPAENSEVSAINNLTLTFDRDIEVIKSGTGLAKLEDENGKVLASSINNIADGKNLVLAFRPGKANLEEGKIYTVHVLPNVLAVKGDETQTNEDLYVDYKGRRQGAVKVTDILPADGSKAAKLDEAENPILLTFDTQVKMDSKETRKAYVYENDSEQPYATLNFAYGDNQVALTPSTTIYLFKDNQYRIEVPAGVITDQAGNGGNDAISFTYTGTYEREISTDDEVLFQNNFDKLDLSKAFLLYDGDQNTPNATAKGWGFESNLPWWVARSSESTTDYAAVSHSMYSPAGKSDDWMVIPQLYIPDANCQLHFQSQSYMKGKKDVLKVYVWSSDKGYNSLSKDIVEKMRTEGKLVYDKEQTPGADQETLENDWTDNIVDLADFAGKAVYIAFVNENDDQSAIFVDNIKVTRNMHMLVSVTTPSAVVNQDDVEVKGVLVANDDEKVYTDLKLVLKDAKGNEVDSKTFAGLQLKKGDKLEFAFDKKLPLSYGEENAYTISVESDGETTMEAAQSVKNLAFAPEKHAVVEEFTGRDCPNCPLGILAFDYLENRFGNKVYPIGIHCYTGDPLGDGMEGYASFLGYSVAPSANVNRLGVYYPVVSNGNDFYYSAKQLTQATGLATDPLWADVIEDELNTLPEADVAAQISYDAESKKLSVPFQVKSALNASGKNYNILAVLVEDDVESLYQKNEYSSYTAPFFGEWGKDGAYGSEYVLNYKNHDVCRYVLGNTYNGTAGLVPQDMQAGVEYKGTLDMPVPATVSDINKCKVIVMLINADNGKFVNAARVAVDNTTGIEHIWNDALSGKVKVYNMQGMKVAEGTGADAIRGLHGVYIVNGKKVVLK